MMINVALFYKILIIVSIHAAFVAYLQKELCVNITIMLSHVKMLLLNISFLFTHT